MTVFGAIIRAIGVPACVVLGLLAFYEGVPGASRIPFLSDIPILGDLATGRVATERAKAAADARRTYVEVMEKGALAAQLAERDRQERARATAIEEYRKRLAIANASEEQANARLEKEIAENEIALKARGRACFADDSDIDFIVR